jgi:hypothetical protein
MGEVRQRSLPVGPAEHADRRIRRQPQRVQGPGERARRKREPEGATAGDGIHGNQWILTDKAFLGFQGKAI